MTEGDTGDRGTLERARRGDRDALADLWRAHHPAVLRYLRARRTVGADDVASQVWIDVAESLHRFEGGPDDFRRWLFTIAHHRGVDSIRRSVRHDELAVRAADGLEPATAEGADVALERETALDRAIALVASLPDQMGAAVMLRVVNELPVADVAAILGTTEGNVRVLAHRGMTRLRRKMSVTDGATTPMGLTS
jgi:RNA polymerase sigma-70 factor (ECF subfamily)